MTELEQFCRGYRIAMLWSNVEGCEASSEDPVSYDTKISDELRYLLDEEAKDFFNGNEILLNSVVRGSYSWDDAGHDFALTRNGHGAGFWDRGFGDVGELLSDLSQAEGSRVIEAVNPDDAKSWVLV